MWRKWWHALTHTAEPPPKVVSDGVTVLLNSEEAGDEPYMLARNLPGVVVLVDKNRVKAGAYAIKEFGCDTLVLDDGFQYLPLKGRLNLLLVDKTNPFGNGFTLPRGILREPIKHLQRASYIFLTKSDGRRDAELEETIRAHNPGVDIIECAHRPKHLQRFGLEERRPLDDLKGRRIGAFSGIAVPESFEKFLKDLGADVVFTRRFLDHYRFGYEDFVDIFSAALANKVDYIVTTERMPSASPTRCHAPSRSTTSGLRSRSSAARRTSTRRSAGSVSLSRPARGAEVVARRVSLFAPRSGAVAGAVGGAARPARRVDGQSGEADRPGREQCPLTRAVTFRLRAGGVRALSSGHHADRPPLPPARRGPHQFLDLAPEGRARAHRCL